MMEREKNLSSFLKDNHPDVPMEVFHSSKADVKEFSPKHKTELSPFGFHFGTAEQANFRTGQYDFKSQMPNVGKYHLSLKNPLEVSHMASFAPDHLADHMADLGILDPDHYDDLCEKHNYESVPLGNALVKILKKNGYDGLMYQNEKEGQGFSFVPFDPTQIKSATGNQGTFDPSNPDITKAKGGEVDERGIPQINNPISVFPKPQRMFPEDTRPAGGQYLNARTKEDMTGHKAAMASIGVNPGGRPYFNASPDSVEQTGSPGRGSAIAKTNLFKQRAGWNWLQAPEGHEDTSTIVSVEHRGDHHYALNAHFPNGVDLARYSEAKSEPRLRPTTRGNLTKGTQVGSISVRGKEHPVYDHVIVKADGGIVGDPDTDEGITAYHGSPHDFEQFDISKIGTGEGAQAFGHGLYFAEAEPVAMEYRDKLTGVDLSPFENIGLAPHHVKAAESYVKTSDPTQPEVAAKDFANWVGVRHTPELTEAFKSAKKQGHMYEVHINAHPDHFLDWDKPFHEQSGHVQQALMSVPNFEDMGHYKSGMKMGALINKGLIPHTYDKASPEFSKAYHAAGIKGVKYLDAGSRGTSEAPTRNYVVFDDKLVNVKRKYAKGGTVQRSYKPVSDGSIVNRALMLTSKKA